MAKKKPYIRLALSIVIGLIVIYLFFTGGNYLRYSSYSISKVQGRNYDALCIQSKVNEHLAALNLPKAVDTIVTGEIRTDYTKNDYTDYMLAYPNELLHDETLLIGTEQDLSEPTAYWAARITNGVVSEAWYAVRPIQTDEIRQYDEKEQRERVEFVTLLTAPRKFFRQGWFYDYNLIGYSNKIIEGNMAKSRE